MDTKFFSILTNAINVAKYSLDYRWYKDLRINAGMNQVTYFFFRRISGPSAQKVVTSRIIARVMATCNFRHIFLICIVWALKA